MSEIYLRKARKRRLEEGHPWVFRTEIEMMKGDPKTGDVVVLRNHQGHFLAQGFYHETSQIAVRIASYDATEKINASWIKNRVKAAFAYRKRFLRDTGACRVIYGEADGLPGLIVDKYGKTAVVQILSSAMEMRRDVIIPSLIDVLHVESIYERSDARTRVQEGLEERTGLLYGECDDVITITENGLSFAVDIVHGQKTGHFFDQRENRLALAPIVRFAADEKPRPDWHYANKAPHEDPQEGRIGASVLDCFCHTGGFGVHAAHFGARSVTFVDQSAQALASAKHNAVLNQVDDVCEFVEANVFDLLRQYEKEQRRFDVVILDPPAFAKGKSGLEGAVRGYRDINLRGLKLVKENGFLVTASCSSPVSRSLFQEIIQEAAVDAHKILRLVEWRGVAKDHPQRLGMAENDYLKFAIYQVNSRS